MSSYKVIQDIEAEDKLIGPLTLRQSIYAGITIVCLYICFLAFAKHALFLIAMFLPVAAITGFFAFPWKGEQPTEIWALARLRFMIKPRVRIWNQSGVKDVVTVLAPRKLEARRPLTNNLSETEVRSRLKALADTIDSRGWATRNASYALYASQYQSRVVAPGQSAPAGVSVAPDMFDDQNNIAQNFDAMLARSSQDQRQRVMRQIAQAQAPPPPPQMLAAPQQTLPQQAFIPPQPAAYYTQYPTRQQQVVATSQGPQLPAPVMPMASYQNPVPIPAANNFWFANGPAYPSSGAGQPSFQQLANPVVQNFIAPGNPMSEPYIQAISTGKISTDVPVATAVAPTNDELAFAEAARQQQALERTRYNHIRVVDPLSGTVSAPSPSVPGMIDYGRPQPTEDQMQYDTSMPQSLPRNAVTKPVTRTPDPAILEFAKNDDLDIATIARQAGKELDKTPSEVEVRLR